MANAAATDPASKWLASMTSPQTAQNYTNGVNAYTGNPMADAAAQANAYVNGVQSAVATGRWQNALLNTPVQVWKTNSVNKGAARLSSGAQAAQSKVQAFFQKFTPVYAQIRSTVQAMPKGGMANALARVQTAITMLKQAAGKPIT